MRKRRISAEKKEHSGKNAPHWPGIALMSLLLINICFLAGTAASYVADAGSSQDAGIAEYGMRIDVPETEADAVQNSMSDYGKIISLDNRSQTKVTYDIVI